MLNGFACAPVNTPFLEHSPFLGILELTGKHDDIVYPDKAHVPVMFAGIANDAMNERIHRIKGRECCILPPDLHGVFETIT